MEFKELVRSRRAVHSFEDREVEEDKIREAVSEARFAPSAWNLQPWKLLVLESRSSREEAAESSYGQDWMLEADKICVLLGDTEFGGADRALDDATEKGYMTEQEAEEFRESVEAYSDKPWEWRELELTANCMFFASDFIEALWSLGIGSCPVKGFDQEELQEELGLERWYPLLLIPLGYPDEELEKKSRKSVQEILEFK